MDSGERTYLETLRRRLHSRPEPSGREEETAGIIRAELEKTSPDRLLSGVGGAGLVATYESGLPGPSILLRSELDGLPVREQARRPHQSRREGYSHACGHDGHMASLVGVARRLGLNRPSAGRVHLLFQPAEETGQGALRVLSDPRFQTLSIDRAYAWHNLPGHETGRISICEGVFAAASVGLACRFTGRSSHAAYPDQGRSPSPLVTALLEVAGEMSQPDPSQPDYAVATVTYVRMGERSFGINPGEAEAGITLRSLEDSRLADMRSRVEERLQQVATHNGLAVAVEEREPFAAVVNAPQPVSRVIDAARACGLTVDRLREPFTWSEDIGQVSRYAPLALFGIGAGHECPPLHAPDYDFPDNLIPFAVELMGVLLKEEWRTAAVRPGNPPHSESINPK